MTLPLGEDRNLRSQLGAERIVSVGLLGSPLSPTLVSVGSFTTGFSLGAVTHFLDFRNGNHPILRVKKSAVRFL